MIDEINEDERAMVELVRDFVNREGRPVVRELEAEIHTADGTVLRTRQQYPPGSPARPPTPDQLAAKLADCVAGLDTDPGSWTWDNAAETLRRYLP